MPDAWAFAPAVCSFSPTFLLTSKYLATQRSMQTLSPLFKSPSAYRGEMHLAWHDLCTCVSGAASLDYKRRMGPRHNAVEYVCNHFQSARLK